MTQDIVYTRMESPFGPVRVAWSSAGLVSVAIGAQQGQRPVSCEWAFRERFACPATDQLDEYFRGTRWTFDLPLVLRGTPFQQDVWRALGDIPFGRTVSYADVARRIGRPRAVRAVGAANARNPLPIVLPCHRVIGADGGLCGYAGGVSIKAALLAFEASRRPEESKVPSADVLR